MSWLNGKKTILGAATLLVAYGPDILKVVAEVVSGQGGDATSVLKIGGYVLALAGLVHKAAKAAGDVPPSDHIAW